MYSKHVNEVLHQRIEINNEEDSEPFSQFNFEDPNVLNVKVIAYSNGNKFDFPIQINKQRIIADLIDQFIQKLKAAGVTDFDASSKKMYHKGVILNDESQLQSIGVQSGDELILT